MSGDASRVHVPLPDLWDDARAAGLDGPGLLLYRPNLLGADYFLTARAAFRLMKAQGIGSSIIFIASKSGLAASPGAAAYCRVKAMELHLARCLALEGAAFGIRVNSVNPGFVKTDFNNHTGHRTVEQGAEILVRLAVSDEHGPTMGFFSDDGPLPW